MPSKKNSVLIFEPQIFLKKDINRPESYFSSKKHEIFGGVLSYDNMRDFPFFFLVRWGGGGTLRRTKDVIFHDLGDQLGGPGTPAKMFLALLDGLQELHLDG